jgi:hypothetical protein
MFWFENIDGSGGLTGAHFCSISNVGGLTVIREFFLWQFFSKLDLKFDLVFFGV